MQLELNPSDIDSMVDTSFGSPFGLQGVIDNPHEHYKLLTYFALQFSPFDNIIDAGTFGGTTALCLAQGGANVTTYDISDKHIIPSIMERHNIMFKQMDILTEEDALIQKADLIFLDLDPHDGIQETRFIKKLEDMKWEGFLIADDIYLNENIWRWWLYMEQNVKLDLTWIGHKTGTGLVIIGNNHKLLYRSSSLIAKP